MENILKKQLKNFLWGKVGKYQIFFVTLQRNSKKGEIYTNDNIDNLRGNQIAPHSPTRLIGDPALPAAPKREKQQEKINILK